MLGVALEYCHSRPIMVELHCYFQHIALQVQGWRRAWAPCFLDRSVDIRRVNHHAHTPRELYVAVAARTNGLVPKARVSAQQLLDELKRELAVAVAGERDL